ncbi:MAG: PD-(D/E)XK nuclease family protein, partial [Anaerotignaceae bacterium]
MPEQFSLQAERDIIAHTDSKGIMEAQVLSFNRLAHHIFSQIGFSKTTPLTDIKKAMVLKKILLENQQKLQYFKAVANKQGFMEQLSTTISELYRYTVSPNQLLASINKGEESDLFSGKISDIALLYNEYSQNIKNGYLSADETLDLLYNCIDESDFIKSAEFWIDGFHGYTPQELKVIEKLLTYGVRVNVTLTIDGWLINKKDISPMNIFYEPWITYNNLTNLATEIGVKVEKPVILTDGLRYKNNDLMELEREFPRSHVKSQNSCENIEIYGGDNPFDEAEKAALKILELVNKGYRYKDIGLLAGTLETYEGILPQVMKECNIPFFMDNKRSILNHPFVGLVKGIMEIALYNLSYNAVFALLKTGLTSMAMEDIDILENYCLAHGIKSYKWKY